jgi:hypothetical protein
MLLAMPIVVVNIITLVFQRMERVVCDLPPGSSSPPEVKDGALAHAQVRHPTAGLDLGTADLPGLAEIDPHVDVRGMEWHIMDQPNAMDHPGSAVVSVIIGHAPGMRRRLYLREQQGLLAFFDPTARVQIVMLPRRDVRSIGTQAVFGDDALEVRVVLAPCDDKPFGSMAFAIMFVRPSVFPDRFRHQGNHGTHVWMDERCAQPLMRLRDRTVTMHRVQAGGTVHGRGGKLPRAIACEAVVAIEKHHLFKRLATLELPKAALEHGTEPLGGDRIKALAHGCVTRDMLDPVDGVHIALGPLLVKGQERGRCEGKHGERRHEGIRSGNVDILTARLRDIGEAASNHVKKRIGREMRACFGSNHGQRKPPRGHITSCTSGGILASMFTKSQCS